MEKIQQQLLDLIRKVGLSTTLDRLRFYWQRFKHAKANRVFLNSHPDVKFPPEYLMYESFQLNYEKYLKGGKHSAQWLLELIKPFASLDEAIVLDWGCGPARIVRHLPDLLPNAEIHGTDYNGKTIDWCSGAVVGVQFKQGQLHPPLNYPEDTFDFIYGISIFTHLSEENHEAWLNELARLLKPGGILFLTTQGDIFHEKLTSAEQQRYDAGELIVRGGVKEGHRVFSAFQPPAYFRALMGNHFSELSHKSGTRQDWGLEQDVFILQKQ